MGFSGSPFNLHSGRLEGCECKGWAPGLEIQSQQARGGPDGGPRAAGPGSPFKVHCVLRVHALHAPQASSTRLSVTNRRASVTRAWSCASRSRYTGKSIATTSTSTARALHPTAASMSHPQQRQAAALAPWCPPRLPSVPWRSDREEGWKFELWGQDGWSRWRWEQIGSPQAGVLRLPRCLLPGALQPDWPSEDSEKRGLSLWPPGSSGPALGVALSWTGQGARGLVWVSAECGKKGLRETGGL